MALEGHSMGPTCAFYSEPAAVDRDGIGPPRVKAQFFYVSSLPIDDPLSPLPPISSDKATNFPPQPFSARDNAALEEAWQGFQEKGRTSSRDGNNKDTTPGERVFSFPRTLHREDSRSKTAGSASTQEVMDFRRNIADQNNSLPRTLRSEMKSPRGESDPLMEELRSSGKRRPKRKNSRDLQAAEEQVMLGQPSKNAQEASELINETELRGDDIQQDTISREDKSRRKRHFSPFRRRQKDGQAARETSSGPAQDDDPPEAISTSIPTDSNISGRPFARAPSKRNVTDGARPPVSNTDYDYSDSEPPSGRSRSHSTRRQKTGEQNEHKVFVPVGVSKLHLVELPELMMKPIYWSPINDTSSVIRATWFYRDTMLPVPAALANQLEMGYEYMMPYGESYQDELQACIDNGASAELKVVYKLYQDDKKPSRPGSSLDSKPEPSVTAFEEEAARQLPEFSENVAVDPRKCPPRRQFATHSVVYVDATNAQILKPNLLPSVRQNRKPLSSIRKGRQIGVAVVRGFNRQAWLKLHPSPKLNERIAHAKVGAYMSQSGDATTRGRRMSCAACDQENKTPKVTNLVLVIHGIGQKLSERVDSFHFTHAINGLRREFNVELSTEAVKGNLKDDSGMMVLPVNWRLTVDFEEDAKDSELPSENKYQLQDITPDTLQGVRSLISDVMLDIPYYLSHHREKMTSAVIREANRVYRLWCRNNPGFEEYGRVHVIAHSLGSVMAMEILSQQPTKLSKQQKFEIGKRSQPNETYFEFDTVNLFCCGSPSGFFLLLNNASLIPRKGRNKPGMEGEDNRPGIAGDKQYGCLAVDNIYNILHRNDPISYLQNASVDQQYAASLQPATIPSVALSFMTKVGNSLRWASSSASDAYAAVAPPARPEMQHMPSTVEMETHNFTREEIAEKRMYLLNDNGQIDYYLNSGGGPLEIQYLNMLSAHSSYWILQDCIRFFVVEIGRKPGKDYTIPVLRAVKKREYKRGNIG